MEIVSKALALSSLQKATLVVWWLRILGLSRNEYPSELPGVALENFAGRSKYFSLDEERDKVRHTVTLVNSVPHSHGISVTMHRAPFSMFL